MDSHNLRDRDTLRRPRRFTDSISHPAKDIANRRRAGKEKAISKKVSKIEEVISERGSRTKIRTLQEQLSKLLDEAYTCHEELMKHLEEGDQEYSDEWVAEVTNDVGTCIASIEEYIADRLEDPPSEISSSEKVRAWCETHSRSSTCSSLASRVRSMSLAHTKQLEDDTADDDGLYNVFAGQPVTDARHKPSEIPPPMVDEERSSDADTVHNEVDAQTDPSEVVHEEQLVSNVTSNGLGSNLVQQHSNGHQQSPLPAPPFVNGRFASGISGNNVNLESWELSIWGPTDDNASQMGNFNSAPSTNTIPVALDISNDDTITGSVNKTLSPAFKFSADVMNGGVVRHPARYDVNPAPEYSNGSFDMEVRLTEGQDFSDERLKDSAICPEFGGFDGENASADVMNGGVVHHPARYNVNPAPGYSNGSFDMEVRLREGQDLLDERLKDSAICPEFGGVDGENASADVMSEGVVHHPGYNVNPAPEYSNRCFDMEVRPRDSQGLSAENLKLKYLEEQQPLLKPHRVVQVPHLLHQWKDAEQNYLEEQQQRPVLKPHHVKEVPHFAPIPILAASKGKIATSDRHVSQKEVTYHPNDTRGIGDPRAHSLNPPTTMLSHVDEKHYQTSQHHRNSHLRSQQQHLLSQQQSWHLRQHDRQQHPNKVQLDVPATRPNATSKSQVLIDYSNIPSTTDITQYPQSSQINMPLQMPQSAEDRMGEFNKHISLTKAANNPATKNVAVGERVWINRQNSYDAGYQQRNSHLSGRQDQQHYQHSQLCEPTAGQNVGSEPCVLLNNLSSSAPTISVPTYQYHVNQHQPSQIHTIPVDSRLVPTGPSTEQVAIGSGGNVSEFHDFGMPPWTPGYMEDAGGKSDGRYSMNIASGPRVSINPMHSRADTYNQGQRQHPCLQPHVLAAAGRNAAYETQGLLHPSNVPIISAPAHTAVQHPQYCQINTPLQFVPHASYGTSSQQVGASHVHVGGNTTNLHSPLVVPNHGEWTSLIPSEPVDQWIDNLPLIETDHAIRTDQTLTSLDVTQRWLVNQNLPRITIPKFDGTPIQWVQFIIHFKEMIHLQPFLSSAQRVAYLLQHLQGDARKAVQGFGIDWTGYVRALKRLKFMFGQRASVVQAHLMNVTSGRPVKDDIKDITQFYYSISECLSTLSRLGYYSDLRSTDVLRNAIRRLPERLRSGWCKKSYAIRQAEEPTLAHLEKWLERWIMVAKDPYMPAAAKQVRRDERNETTTECISSYLTSGDKYKSKCALCDGEHSLYKCEAYLQKTSKERLKLVTSKDLCINCLRSGHKAVKCKSRYRCYVSGCGVLHHTSLHGSLPSGIKKESEKKAEAAEEEEEKGVLVLTDNNFDEVISKHKIILVEFYAPWCRPCKQLAPEYAKAAKTLQAAEPSVPLAKVDCTTQTAVAQTFNISRYPTLKIFRDGNPEDYDGPRKEAGIVSYMKEKSDPNYKSPPNKTVGCTNAKRSNVFMKVVPVKITVGVVEVDTYTLLDDGSEATFIRKDLADELKLNGIEQRMVISTITEKNEEIKTKRVSFDVSGSHDGAESFEIQDAYVLPLNKFTVRAQHLPPGFASSSRYCHLQAFQFKDIMEDDIKLLIGADNHKAIMISDTVEGEPGSPVAAKTLLGWSIFGKDDEATVGNRPVLVNQLKAQEANDELKSFWSTEAFGTQFQFQRPMSIEDQMVHARLEESCYLENGHYVVGMPWKESKSSLPNNRHVAERRFTQLLNKFKRQPELLVRYKENMEEYFQKGYAKLLDPAKLNPKDGVWYLPHHPVVNVNKPGKVRVVFDCAAKCKGVCLNDCLYTGPDFVNNLIGILLRFRNFPVAIVADIDAMYHQVRVSPNDRGYLRFLWKEDLNDPSPPSEYEMQTHVFGATSSACCSTFALRKTGTDNEQDFTDKAVKSVQRDFYVDDWLKSVVSEHEATLLIEQVREILKRGGFHLAKFVSNSDAVLRDLPDETKIRSPSQLKLDQSEVTERTLGVIWSIEDDVFTFVASPKKTQITKREILRTLSSVFDPLGFVTPFTLTAKILVQSLWKQELGWDDELKSQDTETWRKWLTELQRISEYKIRRCYMVDSSLIVCRRELHMFSDASELAFGAAAYMRLTYTTGEVSCHLMMSKSRLAPTKTLTIPRLELQSAVLAVRLKNFIVSEVDVEIDEVHLWTDSIITLQYVRNNTRRFKVFVTNRVAEIREHTEIHQWHHVPGSENPADDLTRGLNINELGEDSRWNRGPVFLYQSPDRWPQKEVKPFISNDDPEVKFNATVTMNYDLLEAMQSYSSWEKLLRVYSWALRFVYNCKGKKQHNEFITVDELRNTEKIIVRLVQSKFFPDELKMLKTNKPIPKSSPLLCVQPFIDERDGLIRVGGRLRNAPMSYAYKHPVIVPSKCKIIERMVTSQHRANAYYGAETLLAYALNKYWILGAKNLVKKIIRNCLECIRRNAKPEIPVMADLPKFRVEPGNPVFFNTGVDLFGPLHTKIGRRNQKRWGCVFTCLATRAIHLEIVESLETSAFVNALERFVNRRGYPSQIISDCGTNFRGADNEMRHCLENLQQEKIGTCAARKGIKWRFNPPDAPHMGGVWESMVKAVKVPLKTILKDSLLTDIQLETVFSEVECIVNSRPLTAVSDDINDFEALTPNHFLIGRSNPNLPLGLFDSTDERCRKRWRTVQLKVEQFWKRWMKEYVPLLSLRRKWNKETRTMNVGDLVLIVNKDAPRGKWKLGRVMEVLPGRDGRVRVVRVKTSTGEFLRPVAKLCLLEEASV